MVTPSKTPAAGTTGPDPAVPAPVHPGAPLAWVVRGPVTESVHTGHLVALDSAGTPVLSLGAPDQEMYARSSLKPLQAVAMLRAGVDLEPDQIALACASHNGEEEHLQVLGATLARAGLSEADLRNTPDQPLLAEAARARVIAGHEPARATQNCSGKHAAMLATCVRNDWPTDTYLDPDHPLQQAIVATVAQLTGQPVAHVSTDGCGAPLPTTTTTGLARAFATLATAAPGTAEHTVAEAMRTHPHLVGGTGRDVTAAMTQIPGLIAKDGAEGVYAAALPDGRSVALKVADGASRARAAALAAALITLGAEPDDGGWDWAREPVLGHGRPVGQVVAAFGADAPAAGR